MFFQEGFRYHHAEPEYLMLVSWISETPDTIPANASHVVGAGALVINKNTKEVTDGAFFESQRDWRRAFSHTLLNKQR